MRQTILRLFTVILMTAGLFGGVSRAYALSGSGTSANPYLIDSKEDWQYFVEHDYSKCYKLTSDIDVGNVMTSRDFAFTGTFDGNGHTIKINIEGVTPYLSLFRHTYGATIKNLKVVGSITHSYENTAAKFSAGLVGHCGNGTIISNCVISVTITSKVRGDGSHGGIVGLLYDTYFNDGKVVKIENCLFNGKLLGTTTSDCGGLVGAGGNTRDECEINYCLFSPSEITMKTDGSSTFSRCNNTTINYSYYTKTFGTAQGGDVSGTSASNIVSLLNGNSNPGVDGNASPWVATNGGKLPYLKTFDVPVKITGWMSGASATSSTNPFMNVLGGSGVKYEYKKTDLIDEYYKETAPTTAGHYHVRATSPDGFQNMTDFYVYDPPTPISPLTFNDDVQTLATFQNTDGGYFNFYVKSYSSSYTTSPNAYQAKTYTVEYIVLGNSGYNDIGRSNPWEPAGSFTVTIDPKPLGSNTISLGQTTYTYDGTEKKPSVTVKDGSKTISSDDYSVSYSNNTNAGTATVTVTEKTGKNYAVNGTATFTINPKEVSSPTIEIPATVTYTGLALTPTVTIKDGNTEIPSSEYTVSYSNNVNVGDVPVVTITDNTGGNYTVNGTTTFTIVKAAPTYTAPTSKDPTYNMNVQELINPGSTNHGTFEYSTDGTNFTTSTTGLVGTDAKDYLIYYKIKGDSNHNDVGESPNAPLTLTATIKPKPVSSPTIFLNPDVYLYDGTAKEPVVTVKDGETVINPSEYTIVYTNNINAGTATVTLKDNEGGNYTVSGTANFTINSIDPNVTPPTARTGLIYNTAAQELITAGSVVGGTLEYCLDGSSYSTTIPTGKDAKTYTVYYRVVGDGNHGDRAPATLEVTISSKTVTSPIINLNPATFVYDGNEKKPEVTVKDGEAIVPVTEYTVEYSNNINVGMATVTIKDIEGGNYIINGSTTFPITQAGVGVTPPTARTLVYNATAQELITAGSVVGGTMEYSLDNANYSVEIPKKTEAGTYLVYWRILGDANHTSQDPVSLSVTISPKTLTDPEIIISPNTYYYDGIAKEPIVTLRDGNTVIPASEYTVIYSDNLKAGSATVTIKDNEGGNYNVSGTAHFTILAASSDVTPPTAMTGLIYNTAAQPLILAGSAVGGTMEYSLDGTNYSTNIPMGTDAGQYTVYYKVVGDGNHADREPILLYVTISPKTVNNPAINLNPQSFTYDGTEKKPEVTVKDGNDIVPASEYAVEYSNNVNVGTAVVTIYDKSGGNYIINGSRTFSILAVGADVTPPTAKTGLVYDGTAQKLIEPGSATGGTMKYSLDRSYYTTEIPTGTDAKKYTVYYKVEGDSNHEDSDQGSLDVTISPKTVREPTIVLTPSIFTYDGTEKKPSVTVQDNDQVIPASEYTVSYSDNTDAGTATVTIQDKEGGNYTVSGKAQFSIVEAVAGVTLPQAKMGLVYNRKAQELITAGSTVGGTMEYSLDNANYSTKIPTGVDAGQYTVYFRVIGDENHASMAPESLVVTMNAKSLSNPVIDLSLMVFRYDGTEKKPDVTVKDGDDVVPASEYTVSYSDNINVGPALVIVRDKEGGNYMVNGTKTFAIVAADAGLIAPTAKTGLVYNGMAQQLIVSGSAKGGTMEYSLDNNTFTINVPTGTDAKTYTVYYRVDGDSNHDDSKTGSLDVTISPKTLTMPNIILTPTTFTFDGTEKRPNVTVMDGDIVIPASEYTVSYSDNTAAGTATVTIQDKNGGNYILSGTAQFSIITAVSGVTMPEVKSGLVYNRMAQDLIVAGSAVGGTMEYSLDNKNYSTKIPTGTDAGQYTVYFRVIGDDNHASMDPVLLSVSINPKSLSNPVIALSQMEYIYDGTEKKPEVTVKDGDDVVAASEYIVEYSNNTNVGVASVVVTDKDGGNYILYGSKNFVIVAKEVGFIPPTPITGLVYNGTAQKLVTTGSTEGGTMVYSIDNNTYSKEVPTGTDAKTYTVYYKVEGDSNHDDSDLGSLEVTISPKAVTSPEIIINPDVFYYDGTSKEPSVTVKDGEKEIPASEYTVLYSDNTNVGSATVIIKDNEGGNYTVSGTGQFKILATALDVTPPTAMTGLVYNTMPQRLITAGTAVGGTMEYSLDNKNYSTDIPTGTNAGQYTVYYRVKSDDNHADMDPVSIYVTISPKPVSSPVITLSTMVFVYDGTEKKPEVTVKDGEVVIPASEYNVLYSDNINVGTAMVTVVDKADGNYIINGTANYKIVAADTDVIPPTAKTGLVYNGTAQELINPGKTKGGRMEYSLDNSSYNTEVPTGTVAKQYTVYYRVVGDENHDDEAAEFLMVTISPKTVSEPNIILDPASFVFDGTEKKPNVTVKDGETVIAASEYTVSYSDNTAAGTAMVTISDKEGGNYTVSGTAHFSIITAVAGVTLPTAISGLIYNGSAQELIIAGSTVGGTMEYSLDNKNYSTKVPSGTDAGMYNVFFRIIGDENHASMDPVLMVVTINAKSLSSPMIVLDPATVVYTGTAREPKVTVKDGDVVVPASEYTVSYSNNINVGTATVTIMDKPGGNYIVSATANFQIYDPNSGFVAPVAIPGLVYNGKPQELVVAGTGVDGVMQYSLDNKKYSAVIPTATDAGTYRVYYKVVNEATNAESNSGSIRVTIEQQTIILSVTLKGAPETVPSITVTDSQGNLMDRDDYTVTITDKDGNVITPVGDKLEVGDYVLIVKPTGNYTGPTVSVSFHVRRALTFVFTMKSDVISVCLPFDRNVPNDYHVYYFDRVGQDGNPVFKRILLDKLIGGEPYLLKYVGSSSAREGTRGGHIIDLSPSSPGLIDMSIQIKSQINQNMVFTGIFDDMTNTKGLVEGAYLLQPDKTWKPLDSSLESRGDEICLEAFQCYVRFKDRSTPYTFLSTTMLATNGDVEPDSKPDNPDDINAIILEDEDGHQEWYDLKGRRIEKPQKGINILRTEDGKTKKVMVR
jgi:methionine-rich copper-binding protein CopC